MGNVQVAILRPGLGEGELLKCQNIDGSTNSDFLRCDFFFSGADFEGFLIW